MVYGEKIPARPNNRTSQSSEATTRTFNPRWTVILTVSQNICNAIVKGWTWYLHIRQTNNQKIGELELFLSGLWVQLENESFSVLVKQK